MLTKKETAAWAGALMLFMTMTKVLWAEPHLKSIKVAVKILSTTAETQRAPPDSRQPIGSRTYNQAIAVLQKEIDRTAEKWEPIISAAPAARISNNAAKD
jgi:hypothetical protein